MGPPAFSNLYCKCIAEWNAYYFKNASLHVSSSRHCSGGITWDEQEEFYLSNKYEACFPLDGVRI